MRFVSHALLAALIGASGAVEVSAQDTPQTSNFASVGFDVAVGDHEAFQTSILDLAKDCAPIRLDEDDFVCLREKANGGQIWIGLRKTGGAYEFITANPGYKGKSAFPVRVQGVEFDPSWEPFEYRLAVRFSDLDIPLLIELAAPREAARFRDIAEPVELTLDVTAFTFNPEIFEDEEAFLAAQKKLGEDIAYAPDFFIPSGDTVYADGPMEDTVEKDGTVIWQHTTLIDAKRKVAESLQEFRDQWKYNMMDAHVQALNASVPTFMQWDDHEVTNNWSDSKDLMGDDRYTEKSVHVLQARATRAFHEMTPLRITPSDDAMISRPPARMGP